MLATSLLFCACFVQYMSETWNPAVICLFVSQHSTCPIFASGGCTHLEFANPHHGTCRKSTVGKVSNHLVNKVPKAFSWDILSGRNQKLKWEWILMLVLIVWLEIWLTKTLFDVSPGGVIKETVDCSSSGQLNFFSLSFLGNRGSRTQQTHCWI